MDPLQFHRPVHLHEVMEYGNEQERVRTLIAERHPFNGVKNYFTDSLLYQDSFEIYENLYVEEPDFGNEANMEPEVEEGCL